MTNKINEFFNERAAIYQFEADFSQKESELMAYKDSLKEFVEDSHKEILADFEAQIGDYKPESEGVRIAVKGKYIYSPDIQRFAYSWLTSELKQFDNNQFKSDCLQSLVKEITKKYSLLGLKVKFVISFEA